MNEDKYAALYARIEAAGHKLIRTPWGKIDDWALDVDEVDDDGFSLGYGHNGPMCELCKETWCEHCELRYGDEIEPCEVAKGEA